MKEKWKDFLLIGLLIILLFAIRANLGLNNDLFFNDFTKTGGISVAIRDFGLRPALGLVHMPHGSMLINSIIFQNFLYLDNWLLIYKLIPIFVQSLILLFSYVLFKRLINRQVAFFFGLLIVLGPKLFYRSAIMYSSQQEAFLFSLVLVYLAFIFMERKLQPLFFLIMGFSLFIEPTIVILIFTIFLFYFAKVKLKQLIINIVAFATGLLPFILVTGGRYVSNGLGMFPSFFSFCISRIGLAAIRISNLFDFGIGFQWLFILGFLISFCLVVLNGMDLPSSFMLLYGIIFFFLYAVASPLDSIGSQIEAFQQRNVIYLFLPIFYFVARATSVIKFRAIAVGVLLIFLGSGVYLAFNYPVDINQKYNEAMPPFIEHLESEGLGVVYSSYNLKWSGYLFSKGKIIFSCGIKGIMPCPSHSDFFERFVAKAYVIGPFRNIQVAEKFVSQNQDFSFRNITYDNFEIVGAGNLFVVFS